METNRPADSKNDFGAVANHISDFRTAAFALCRWARDKPENVRANALIAVMNLRRLTSHDTTEYRENALRALSRLET